MLQHAVLFESRPLWQKNSRNQLNHPLPNKPQRRLPQQRHHRLRRRTGPRSAEAAAAMAAVSAMAEAAVVDAADSAAAAAAAEIAIAAAKVTKAESNPPSSASIAAPRWSRAAGLSASAPWLLPATVREASAYATARPTKCRRP